ncbi:MAG: hypothetical protein JWM53_4823 [bacterium]|nr:hypothetical protein [bacterium]
MRSLAILIVLGASGVASAQDRGESHGGLRIFAQPAPSDYLLVITPSVTGKVAARRWLTFDVDWTADVVTGATRRTYGSPDVVTSATQFTEVRNVIGAGAGVIVGPATITAGYAYGTENDYRSQLVRAGVTFDLANHDTVIVADYSHGFDRVCDLDQPGVALTLRQPLDTSHGCFAGTVGLTEERLDIDNVELTLTQTLTRRLIGAVSGTYQHLDGFQSNPYRRVRLDGGLEQAQESHPRLRDRGAFTARVRYAIARLGATLGGDLRLYRDTWGVQSITGEVTWEQPFHVAAPAWRYVARARGYVQSGATFYRDVGYADSYERAGPVGSFFTADQELAPLADLVVGASFVHASSYPAERRRLRMFTDVEWNLGLDYVKIFALTPEPPNAARMRSWASALVLSLSATGRF